MQHLYINNEDLPAPDTAQSSVARIHEPILTSPFRNFTNFVDCKRKRKIRMEKRWFFFEKRNFKKAYVWKLTEGAVCNISLRLNGVIYSRALGKSSPPSTLRVAEQKWGKVGKLCACLFAWIEFSSVEKLFLPARVSLNPTRVLLSITIFWIIGS